jgi:hypothetical protein
MNEAAPLAVSQALAKSDGWTYFEQRLFVISPFGTFATALSIFVLLVATFAALAIASRESLIAFEHGNFVVPSHTRAALVLSLLIATALGLQRWSRIKDREELACYPGVLRSGVVAAAEHFGFVPANTHIFAATMIGVAIGIGASVVFLDHAPLGHLSATPPMFYWFAATTTILSMLFTRGVEFTRTGANATRRFVDAEMTVDLLRIDRLSVIGRTAARTALIWFSTSAITCLFLIGSGIAAAAIGISLICFAMGIAIFLHTMDYVHKKIVAAKTAELDRVRAQIGDLRSEAHTSADAAMRMQGLLAYEARIAATHEWPYDHSTAVRFGASSLILAVPWIGRAIAGTIFDHLGQIIR